MTLYQRLPWALALVLMARAAQAQTPPSAQTTPSVKTPPAAQTPTAAEKPQATEATPEARAEDRAFANEATEVKSPSSIRSLLVLDDPDGGAMTRKLSLSATMLYTSMGNREDEVGIYVDGGSALRVAPAPLSSASTYSNLRRALAGLTEVQPASFPAVARFAQKVFKERKEGIRDAIVVLAHAGKEGETRPFIPSSVVGRLSSQRIPVFVVAFGRKVDLKVYEPLAQHFGGAVFGVATGAELKKAFSDIFTKLHDTETIPVVGDRLVMDGTINEATVVVPKRSKRDRVRIVTPGERVLSARTKYPGVKWKSFDEYDLVKITNPEAGSWRVRQPSNMGGVVSHVNSSGLRLSVSVSPRQPMVSSALQIRAHLEENGAIVDSYSQLKHMVLEAEIRDPAGRLRPLRLVRGSGGQFMGEIRNEIHGYHEVRLSAFSPDVQRERRFTYLVNPACFTGRFARSDRQVVVDMSRTCPRFAKLYATVSVEDTEGTVLARSSFRRSGRQLLAEAPAPELGRKHILKVDIRGSTLDGHSIKSNGGGPFEDKAREPTWMDYLSAVGGRLLVLNIPFAVGLLGIAAVRQARSGARRNREDD